jgi:hypothetical protein
VNVQAHQLLGDIISDSGSQKPDTERSYLVKVNALGQIFYLYSSNSKRAAEPQDQPLPSERVLLDALSILASADVPELSDTMFDDDVQFPTALRARQPTAKDLETRQETAPDNSAGLILTDDILAKLLGGGLSRIRRPLLGLVVDEPQAGPTVPEVLETRQR